MKLSWGSLCVSLVPLVVGSSVENTSSSTGAECIVENRNEELGVNASSHASLRVDDVNETSQGKKREAAEAGYVYPKNLTVPAPKTYAGLGTDLGEPQHLDTTYSSEIYKRIEEAREYLENEVKSDENLRSIAGLCVNKHSSCAFWSVIGECENNPAYMTINCAPVCKSCEMLHIDTRCPVDLDAVDAFARPGDLNKMFERIVSENEFKQYEPVVLSRPPEGPWMVMFEKAISDDEAERLIELGGQQGYELSADVGEEQEDGTYSSITHSGRTSTNAWCVDACYEDPITQRVMNRIENITGIPETNTENLQLLRYGPQQYYQTHSDYIDYQRKRQCGVRILTFYMYLNDVEEGGGTHFPQLGKTVTPKRGRAVLWPSVLDEDPNTEDPRTVHTAMKVIEGVKHGANAWVHQRDFKGPNKRACA